MVLKLALDIAREAMVLLTSLGELGELLSL